MHAVRLLHKQLQCEHPEIHSKRLEALMSATKGLSEDHRLSITGIGRALHNHTSAKHNIKRIDRLVGNTWLQAERGAIYGTLAQWLLKNNPRPIILVDWSDLTVDREQQLLRASIPAGGRGLTLYEEVHPLKKYANPGVHRHFVQQLKALLPDDITPIIVTDAGFRGTWFKLINAFGWHWIGRVRNRDFVQLAKTKDWMPCKSFYKKATRYPRRLGNALLSYAQPNSVVLHVVKKPKRGRVEKSKCGQPTHNARSNKIAQREREPWLIATSPSLEHLTAKHVMSIYRKRMQIEEAFRDIKCERYGLGLSSSLTTHAKRLEILLLLGALALLVLWMAGVAAIKQKDHYRYQSNTIRNRRVLSSVFVGMQILRHDPGKFTQRQLRNAFDNLKIETTDAAL